MALSAGELAALKNLADKYAGKPVGWISIADARAVANLGLAARSGGGWMITIAGLEALKGHETGGSNVVAGPGKDSAAP